MAFDPVLLRKDFPILDRQVHGKRLIYLDSTATTQKPIAVLQAMDQFYRQNNANIHRGVHTLAEESTSMYEDARMKVGRFINAPAPEQVIFTRNATESINLVARTWARSRLRKGDRIILTEMEHHSNLVPWHMLARECGIELEFITVTPDGLLDMDVYRTLLALEPKLVAITGMSNVLGTINSVAEMTRMAHEAESIFLLDGAQLVPHIPVDVQALDIDFLAFSAHKMLGPTGIGVLYGRQSLLESMPAFLGGGDMIKSVHLRDFVPNDLPHKFEAGTPAIAEAVGFAAALDYLNAIGMQSVAEHEREIITYALERLDEVPGVRVFGPTAEKRGAVAAFTLEGVHPHDVAQIVDTYGVAVRAGHHCAQPLHEKFGIPASTRASFYLYNDRQDVDALIAAIYEVKKVFD